MASKTADDGVISPVLPDGGVLPFPPVPSGSIAGRTLQESTYHPRQIPKRLHDGSPNIVIVLIDDAGPACRRRSAARSRPRRWTDLRRGCHLQPVSTTAMCSPTRASLLTRRNHHEIGNGRRGTGQRLGRLRGQDPRSSATVAEVLRQYGYATSAFGKWHNTPAEETTAAGPFDNWPTGLGFEHFYGFLAGEASQYEPNLVRNTTIVPPPAPQRRGYHLSEDLADEGHLLVAPASRRSTPTNRSSCTGPAAACMARTTS